MLQTLILLFVTCVCGRHSFYSLCVLLYDFHNRGNWGNLGTTCNLGTRHCENIDNCIYIYIFFIVLNTQVMDVFILCVLFVRAWPVK